MVYNNRRVNNQFSNSRTVSYNSGGLNERFSKIVNMQKNRNEEPARSKPLANRGSSNTSVFGRLRAASNPTSGRGNNNIKSRLGRTVGGGIKKNSNRPTPMSGVIKTGNGNKRIVGGKRGGVVAKKTSVIGKKKLPVKGKKPVEKKKCTAEDLDKALDAYMMKDPKTARARLDDDMNAYMAEAEDILMNESL